MVSRERNLDWPDAAAACRRASDRARRVAIQTGTKLVFWRDGKVIYVDPETLPLCSPDDPPGQPIPPALV